MVLLFKVDKFWIVFSHSKWTVEQFTKLWFRMIWGKIKRVSVAEEHKHLLVSDLAWGIIQTRKESKTDLEDKILIAWKKYNRKS